MLKFTKTILYIVIVSFSSFVSFACQNKNISEKNDNESLKNNKEPNQTSQSKSEETASNFSLQSIDGKEISMEDYEGKIIILDFWATWCGPCRKGIPDLVELQKKYKDDLVIIGISLDSDTRNDVIPFTKEYKINYPVVYGNEEIVNDYGGINAIPTTFVLDTERKIVAKYIGLVDKETYVQLIENLKEKS
ncbi:MAG: TlpA disulfide reductase family protein [Ignavibacteriaceae bacterium]